MNNNFTVEIASVPDRENLVAEIWLGDIMVAELSDCNGKAMLEIYPNDKGSRWNVECEEFIGALLLAEKKLAGSGMTHRTATVHQHPYIT
ncbi:MAG: hypothetical protein DRI57_07645 [Deltaproteobacteria bacterium]|nr:MAG: hypothetical protein DRI57_07645 [Deltaproteobacteria bacterium]